MKIRHGIYHKKKEKNQRSTKLPYFLSKIKMQSVDIHLKKKKESAFSCCFYIEKKYSYNDIK